MSEIIGPAAAKAALAQLVAQIRSSLSNAGGGQAYKDAVDKAQSDLEVFSNDCRAADVADSDEVAAVNAITQLAFDLQVKLSLNELEDNIKVLEEGADKLAALATALDQQTAANVHSAASIGLKPVKDTIDSMTSLVETVKNLKSNLSAADPDEAKVAAEIDKLVAQFQALRAAASQIG